MKNISKRLFSFALAVMMVVSMMPTKVFAADTVTADLLISTADELKAFADEVNAGNSYEGKLVVLTDDINLEYTAVVIGTKANPFKGTFDGQNHTVDNLTIYEDGSESDYFADTDDCLGLFGVINTPAVIKNVTVNNPYIVGSSYVGGIVGMGYTGKIENCHVTGEIDIEGYYMVGGINGHGYARITSCSVIGKEGWDYNYVGASYKEANLEGDNVGGIVGHNGENNPIQGCTVKNVTVSGTRKIGGIVGITDMNTSITNCKVEGVVVGTTATADYAADNGKTMSMGGIVGQYQNSGSNGTITGCTVSDLTFTNEYDVNIHAGALTGGVRGTDAAVGTTEPAITVSGNAATNVKGSNVDFCEPASSYAVKIGEQGYETLADALAAAKTMTGDVTVEIYDKVTLNSNLTGSFDSIKFVGKEADAEVYLEVQGYITATGKKVSFEDLTLSKSEGGFITNAGFMNVAFGVYDVAEVTYTNCTFANGAYASSGKVTYTDCTFYRSHDKYGLWAYGNVDVTVDSCTFADYRGIKMYAEGAAKTTNLTVKSTDFSAVNDKPAIVLTYGESVTLEDNTYSSTGVFELDLDGAPYGTAVTSDVAPTCKNDNGACGVLVDGKIYTTVAQAAAVATAGSTVTLLHDSAETVELAEGVILNKNGYAAEGVTIKTANVAAINGVGYNSLEEAFSAAQAGETITLLADIELTDGIVISADDEIVLDLNGYTISQTKACTESYAMIKNNGKLTITGNGKISFTDSGAGDPAFGWGSYTIQNNGTLVVENGTIENLSQQNAAGSVKHMYCAIWQYSGSTTIDGGTISTPTYRSVRLWKGEMTINGGTFEGQVWVQAVDSTAELTINNGSFAPRGVDGSSVFVGNIDNSGKLHTVEFKVTGGTFATKIGANDAASLNGPISGGSFSAAAVSGTNSALLADGLEFVENADGTYGVQTHTHTYTGTVTTPPTTTTEGVKTYTCDCGDSYTETMPVLPQAIVTDKGATTYAGSYYIYDVTTGKITSATGGINLPKTLVFTAQDQGEAATNNYYANYNTDFYVKLDGLSADAVKGTGCYLAGYYEAYELWVIIPLDNVDIQDGIAYPLLAIAGQDFSYEMICNGVKEFTCGLYLSEEFLAANPNVQVTVDLGLREEQIKDLGDLENLEYFQSEGFKYDKEELDAELVAMVGNVKYYTLEEAIAAAKDGDTVTLLTDVTLDGVTTIERAITLNLGGNTLTGADGAIVLNVKADTTVTNGTILGNKSGTSSGLIDIYANLTMNGVTMETSKINALRFKAGGFKASLTDCSITGAFKGYGDSTWEIYSGTYKASSTSINDQLNGTAAVCGGIFHYEIAETECAPGYVVVDNGDGTWTVQYAPACFVDADNDGILDEGEAVYGNLDQVFANHTEGDVYVVLTSNIPANGQVDTDADAHYYFTTNVAEGVTVDFLFAEDWNYIQKMTLGENITLNAPYLLAWTELNIYGTVDTGYAYFTVADVTVHEGGVLDVTTGDATVQVKNGASLTVNGTVKTNTINVWAGESKLNVSGEKAKVEAAWIDIWDGAPTVTVENGATVDVDSIKVSRGGAITVDAAALDAENLEVGHNGESAGTVTVTNNGTITNAVLTVVGSTINGPESMNVTSGVDGYKVVYEGGIYKLVQIVYVAYIGEQGYETVDEAVKAAKDGDTVRLDSADAAISMNATVDGGRTITFTGVALVDWTKGNLWIGRNGTGSGKVIFDGATITSAVKKNPAGTGIHVSGAKAGSTGTCDGVLVIKNSTIELDYLINRNEVIVSDNSELTVYGGTYVHGRAANESASGTDEIATLTVKDSKLTIVNSNGEGFGGESYGELVLENAQIVCQSAFIVNANGIVKMDANSTITATKLTGAGSIKINAAGLTADKVVITAVTADFTGTVTVTGNDSAEAKVNGDNVQVVIVETFYVAQNLQTGVKYENVQEALNGATKGDTIQLLTEETVEELYVGAGKTLDLNGNKLTADTVAASFSTSYIIDSKNGQGLLAVDQANISLNKGNAQLPLWTAEGAQFVDVTFGQALDIKADKNGNEGNLAYYRFAITDLADETILDDYLANGTEGTCISMRIKVTYTGASGTVTQYFDIPTEFVEQLVNSGNGWDHNMIKLNLTGVAGKDVKLSAEIVSTANPQATVVIASTPLS